jgi:hypothetical protein
VCRFVALTLRTAAPLCLGDVHIWVNDDVLGSCRCGDCVPNFKPGGVLGPTGVLFDDLLGNSGTVGVTQSVDHGDFERDIHALTLVDLVNHFNRIRPGLKSVGFE